MTNKIDINHLKRLFKSITEFNSLDLSKCTFIEDGKIVNIDKKLLDEFKYTGLNNMYFITCEYYKMKDTIFTDDKK